MSRPTTQSAPASGTTTPYAWIDQPGEYARSKRAAVVRYHKMPEAAADTPATFRMALGSDVEKKVKQYEDWAGNKAPAEPKSWLEDLGRKGREWSKDKPVLGALDKWMFGNEVD
jgi:hypothetical protein